MTAYLLDSDVCIYALKPKRNALLKSLLSTLLSEGGAISVITYGEVVEGVLFSNQRALSMQRWREFVEPLDVIGVTTDIAEIWAELRGGLRRQGRPGRDNDLLIAATALRFDLTLVTRNASDFEHVDGLELIVPELEDPAAAARR